MTNYFKRSRSGVAVQYRINCKKNEIPLLDSHKTEQINRTSLVSLLVVPP